MDKPVLIVTPSRDIYGSYTEAPDAVEAHVSRVITEPYSPEGEAAVIDYLKEHPEVTTILSRGIWYNHLYDAEYIRQNPHIRVTRLIINSRTSLREFTELWMSGFRRIGYIVIHSSANSSLPENSLRTMSENSFIRSIVIRHAEEYESTVLRMIKEDKLDVLWGDVMELDLPAEYNLPRYQHSVNGYSLRYQINAAVDYHNSRMEQIYNERMRSYLSTMTRTIDESVFLLDGDGRVLISNDNLFIMSEDDIDESGRTIEEYTGVPLSNLIERPNNRYLTIDSLTYIANLITFEIAYRSTDPKYALILNSVSRISSYEMTARMHDARHKFPARYQFDDILAYDPQSLLVKRKAEAYAGYDETILITGETGSGKEMYASSIHNASSRRPYPFVAVNCATLSESLIDSELFGYEKGSFTGALASGQKGLFESAHHGTIFLDEIGELPLSLQAKLLRVLQEHTIMRIGGREVIPVDVRVITATNRDLVSLCEKGLFRYDLYYRLAMLELPLPPLRERKGDIIPIFRHWLQEYLKSTGKKMAASDEALQPLLAYSWPGNIRELRYTAFRLVIISEERTLDATTVRQAMPATAGIRYKETEADQSGAAKQSGLSAAPPAENIADAEDGDLSVFRMEPVPSLPLMESKYVAYLYRKMNEDKEAVCRYLGISPTTLWRKLSYREKT